MFLHYVNFVLRFFGGEVGGEVCEKVVVESPGNACKQGGVDCRALENVVDVRACAVELPGEPRDGVAARHGVEYFLDSMADMNHPASVIGGGLFPIAPGIKK